MSTADLLLARWPYFALWADLTALCYFVVRMTRRVP